MKEKEQIIAKLDFTEEQYEEVRKPYMYSFDELIDNAIKVYEDLIANGFQLGDKIEEVAYILNDMWSQFSK